MTDPKNEKAAKARRPAVSAKASGKRAAAEPPRHRKSAGEAGIPQNAGNAEGRQAPESDARRAERLAAVVDWFRRNMPAPQTELNYGSPFELLVAVVLSAQCTDRRVNQITPALFAAFPDCRAMAQAGEEAILERVRSCSYPNSKARHLAAMARMLDQEFGGQVPSDIDQLCRLPGVGRKTANVMASVVFGQAAMAVDTHVFRVSARLGLTRGARNPLEAERQLVAIFDAADIPRAHHWLILHGRYVCQARSPKCAECGLAPFCPSSRNAAQ